MTILAKESIKKIESNIVNTTAISSLITLSLYFKKIRFHSQLNMTQEFIFTLNQYQIFLPIFLIRFWRFLTSHKTNV